MTTPLLAGFEEHFVRGAPPAADLGWKHNPFCPLLHKAQPHIYFS